jgi:hypothetical protein
MRTAIAIGLLACAVAPIVSAAGPPTTAGPSKVATATAIPASPSVTPALSGTLFYSDAERGKLERARRTGIVEPEEEWNSPQSVINGMVKHSDGGATVWLDGQMVGNLDRVLANRVQTGSVGHPSGFSISVSGALSVQEVGATQPAPVHPRARAKDRKKR